MRLQVSVLVLLGLGLEYWLVKGRCHESVVFSEVHGSMTARSSDCSPLSRRVVSCPNNIGQYRPYATRGDELGLEMSLERRKFKQSNGLVSHRDPVR